MEDQRPVRPVLLDDDRARMLYYQVVVVSGGELLEVANLLEQEAHDAETRQRTYSREHGGQPRRGHVG